MPKISHFQKVLRLQEQADKHVYKHCAGFGSNKTESYDMYVKEKYMEGKCNFVGKSGITYKGSHFPKGKLA